VPGPQITSPLLLAVAVAHLATGCFDADVIEHGGAPGWEGGGEAYRRWSAGPSPEPTFFPVAVWMQQPANAAAYKAIGINVFLGLWKGPTPEQLAAAKSGGVSTVCAQNELALHAGEVIAWMHDNDQPDDAQLRPDNEYDPCLPAATVHATYARLVARDPTRPVLLQFGPGVAGENWVGRGPACGGRLDLYPDYLKGADITAFHVYPVNSEDPALTGKLWLYATGVDRLRAWSRYTKPVWTTVETTGITAPARTPTPAQIKAEVWMSLVHGAMGVIYYVHVFEPTFNETGLLANATNRDAVRDINEQLHALAPVLNAAPVAGAASVTSSDPRVPIDFVVKRQGGATYLFAVAMRDGQVDADIAVAGAAGATAEVLGEKRRIPLVDGKFRDSFAPYAVHLYKIGL
jgi:hypothetical protein